MRSALLLVALALVAVTGCAPNGERPELDQLIRERAISAGDQGIVSLTDLDDFDWDHLFAFAAYATDDDVRDAVGDAWPSGGESRIPSDGQGLVVFVRGGQIAAWSILNETASLPGVVHFDDTGVAIPADQAEFRAVIRDQTIRGNPVYYLALIRSALLGCR
jgi:hypothetical protein